MLLPGPLLSQAGYDELERFLDSDDLPKDYMCFSGVHGLPTALAIGPVDVPPSEWFPLTSRSRDQRSIFRSPEEENRIRHLVMLLYHDIEWTFLLELEPEELVYEPLFEEFLEEEGKPRVFAEGWCYGFYFGVIVGLGWSGEDWFGDERLLDMPRHYSLGKSSQRLLEVAPVDQAVLVGLGGAASPFRGPRMLPIDTSKRRSIGSSLAYRSCHTAILPECYALAMILQSRAYCDFLGGSTIVTGCARVKSSRVSGGTLTSCPWVKAW